MSGCGREGDVYVYWAVPWLHRPPTNRCILKIWQQGPRKKTKTKKKVSCWHADVLNVKRYTQTNSSKKSTRETIFLIPFAKIDWKPSFWPIWVSYAVNHLKWCCSVQCIRETRPSVNYAKDWLDHLFLFPGLVWSTKEEFHFGCDHQGAVNNHFPVYWAIFGMVTNERTTGWS